LFTHRGVVRARNEDAIFANGTLYQDNLRDVVAMRLTGGQHVLLVADGIGGRPEGAFASWTALRLLSSDVQLLDGPSGCENALHAANGRVEPQRDRKRQRDKQAFAE
jgi:PPM family protein phosphatase